MAVPRGPNAALNALRVHGYDHDELRESVRSTSPARPEDHERRWVMRRTLTGLAALPEAQREALLRTAVEGRSQEQVAAELGLSEGAVRGLVYRARAALRAAATALTPAPLVGWAAAFASSDVPMNAAERIAQVAAGGGTASVGAMLAKGARWWPSPARWPPAGLRARHHDGRGGPSQAEADTIKPGHTARRGGAAPPGATLATQREHGAAGEAGRERHGRGERGDDQGGARPGGGESHGKGSGSGSGKRDDRSSSSNRGGRGIVGQLGLERLGLVGQLGLVGLERLGKLRVGALGLQWLGLVGQRQSGSGSSGSGSSGSGSRAAAGPVPAARAP